MANYTTTANVVLQVNGRQAQKMLTQLDKDAIRLEKQIAKAAAAGDKATMKKLQRELKSTNKMMEQIKGSASTVDNTLRRLNTATPCDLQRSLKQLQSQLSGIQRGTPAWDAHVAKIKLVKAELQKVNATMATQQSLFSRLNGMLNSFSTAIMGAAAAITGLIMAGRKAVQKYADMEEQLANTQKYTRMTRDDVLELNEAFKNMDTRIGREQLNLLAQEGGRLGYNTVQSVQEYVEAASIINVALVDLGEGATQTIAKLSNIFGMEQMYGVRDSMLKIGSTVNHLSQNCTAAKPYLVNFAQRMAGIGSSAKMTIPEILAFGATLDAHGQKVEMSSTALQRTIMTLFKKPAEMAQKVGLDAKQFTETLNKSTTEGVMMFLDALNKLGESNALAVLSPLFQDLGLDGTRVSSVLMNLSSHLDFLKWQLGEAAGAFRDGTSASNEYAIFNNTVQASIDKARKRVGELAVELGEKLYPVMRHIYTSSSVFLRVLNQIVSFVIANRRAIVSLISVLAAYYGTILAVKTVQLAYIVVVKLATGVQKAWQLMVIASRIVVIAFTKGIGAATHAMKLFNAVSKANAFGLIVAAVTTAVIAIKSLVSHTSELTKKLREAANVTKTFASELMKEKHQLDGIFGKLEACKKGTKEYKAIKDELVNQYGKYMQGLINEKGEINNLTAAYNRLAAAARIAAKERSINTARQNAVDAYEETFSEQIKQLQESLINFGKDYRDAVRITNRVMIDLQTTGTLGADIVAELQGIKGSLMDSWGWTTHPVNIVNKIIGTNTEYRSAIDEINTIEQETNPLAFYNSTELKRIIPYLEEKAAANEGGTIVVGMTMANPSTRSLSAREVQEFLDEAKARLSSLEHTSEELVAGNPDFDIDEFTPYETDRERRARETAEHRAEVKARKEFKDALNAKKGEWEGRDAANIADYSAGLKSWQQFLLDKYTSEVKYFDDRMAIFEQYNLQEDEDYQELLKKKQELQANWLQRNAALSVEEAKRRQKMEENQAQMDYASYGNPLFQKEEALNVRLHAIRIKYLEKMRDCYNKTSEEYHDYQLQIEDEVAKEKLRRQQASAKKIQEWLGTSDYKALMQRMTTELEELETFYKAKLISEEEFQKAKKKIAQKYLSEAIPAGFSQKNPETDFSKKQQKLELKQQKEQIAKVKKLLEEKIISEEDAAKAIAAIRKKYEDKWIGLARKNNSEYANMALNFYEAWRDVFKKSGEDGENWATKTAKAIGATAAIINSFWQQSVEYMQACSDLEIAITEKKYDREIELAQGNSYKVSQAEKEKEAEIARLKNEAEQRMYAMKMFQAVAQMAQNAILAYGAGLQVGGPLGLALAPISAALALAAGGLQIATIQKQKEASAAQGYASGGFTPIGPRDKEVGVVHAGEWVASQQLVNNPTTRPLLQALDYAQKHNVIGSLSADDVSRSITAPMVIAAQAPQQAAAPVVNVAVQAPAQDNSAMEKTLAALNDRLNEPFVTINTISGDYGVKAAQDKYNRLIANKTPKSKR